MAHPGFDKEIFRKNFKFLVLLIQENHIPIVQQFGNNNTTQWIHDAIFTNAVKVLWRSRMTDCIMFSVDDFETFSGFANIIQTGFTQLLTKVRELRLHYGVMLSFGKECMELEVMTDELAVEIEEFMHQAYPLNTSNEQ